MGDVGGDIAVKGRMLNGHTAQKGRLQNSVATGSDSVITSCYRLKHLAISISKTNLKHSM